uniref:Uncharacterized protein n=1 Tax=Arundo donax TaxID=35708 RepID=A0A0A8YFA9_ARUDO
MIRLSRVRRRSKRPFMIFTHQLGSSEQRDITLNLSELQVQHHDLSPLDELFTEDEVWATIKDLPQDKASGPDGFTGRFYRTC